jgi:predicted alpha/beta hydrolase
MGEQDAAKRLLYRRSVLAASAGMFAASALASPLLAAMSDTLAPIPLPAQVPVKEGIAAVSGTHLSYWDTGGNSPAIVLLHPATGSARIWSYQQPVFARAGYRVIAHSRRGYAQSDPVPKENSRNSVG